jgi:molecular chaperone DnaK (HSP70)
LNFLIIVTESHLFLSSLVWTQKRVGEDANAANCGDNIITNSKRCFGHSPTDPNIIANENHFSFKVKRGKNEDNVLYNVDSESGKIFECTPEECATYVLIELFGILRAQKRKDQDSLKCVLTVPAHFVNAQRQLMKTAANIAGFEVLSLINDSTAADLSHIFDKEALDVLERYIFIDIGGGTLDSTIIQRSKHYFEILASKGDQFLGGTDFNNVLFDYLLSEYEKRIGDKMCLSETQKVSLQEAAVFIQCQLTKRSRVKGRVPGFLKMDYEISRIKFEELIQPLLQRMKRIVAETVAETVYSFEQVKNVLLVGGSAIVPAVQKTIGDMFGPEKVTLLSKSRTVVARGACIMAALLTDQIKEENGKIEIIYKLSNSFGKFILFTYN